MNNLGIVTWKWVSHSDAADQFLRLFAEQMEFLGSCSSLPSMTRDSGVFQSWWMSFLTVSLRTSSSSWTSVVDFVFWSRCHRFESPRTLRNGFTRTPRFVCFGGQRMFSLRDWKDPGVHDANSAWVRLFAVTWEIDTFCCTILLLTSCFTTFSMHIAGKVLKKGRLRWIVSDKIAIPSAEQPSNYTHILYFGDFSKYSCTLQSWADSGRNQLLRSNRRCEEHRLSIFLKTSASRNQPRLNDGVQVVSVPKVIDVLDEVVWQQYVVLQCRINKGASWMTLNCSNVW